MLQFIRIPLSFAVNITYTNHRTSVCNDQEDKDNVDVEDVTKDFDRFVVSIP